MIYLAISPQGEPWINTAAWSREECERMLRGPFHRDHGEEYLKEKFDEGWTIKAYRMEAIE